jgi:hypothetical protein
LGSKLSEVESDAYKQLEINIQSFLLKNQFQVVCIGAMLYLPVTLSLVAFCSLNLNWEISSVKWESDEYKRLEENIQ